MESNALQACRMSILYAVTGGKKAIGKNRERLVAFRTFAMLKTFCEGAFINPYSKIFTTTYLNCLVQSLLKNPTSDGLFVLKLSQVFLCNFFFIFRLVFPQLLLLRNLPLCCHGNLQVQKINVMDLFLYNSEEALVLLPKEGADFVCKVEKLAWIFPSAAYHCQ